ncbi:aldo/keto reductase [Poritiphilus flavus]|uniref:Aldo/keto reductase n=1 Tax=Poritiphilus flavus TaxID=2697053 RepID=A0A6L9EDV1_9FLAO|nr:aldo/keto reductase [Poritiphilus flavus]NAS12867.1 aldo/keto reductase [Poritiphilus flavus]
MRKYSRREMAKQLACMSAGTLVWPSHWSAKAESIRTRKIPSSGEQLPIVGLGTWQSFDVGTSSTLREQLEKVLSAMKQKGGKVIDSSPMYGSSEQVVGDLTAKMGIQSSFFYATKVWTSGKQSGIRQMETSKRRMRRPQMDLMQIHNLVDLQTHIKTLREWKEKAKIRYWGITHYTNSSHEKLARIIQAEKPDFVQFNYSINQRNAENRLLGVARDQGTAVLINRPYDGGSLFRAIKGKELPAWCKEADIHSWGQFFLKYILAHEAVNCAIPGTSKPHHLLDNMGAGFGRLPDATFRKRMVQHLNSI